MAERPAEQHEDGQVEEARYGFLDFLLALFDVAAANQLGGYPRENLQSSSVILDCLVIYDTWTFSR